MPKVLSERSPNAKILIKVDAEIASSNAKLVRAPQMIQGTTQEHLAGVPKFA